jgi:hypothetical protein
VYSGPDQGIKVLRRKELLYVGIGVVLYWCPLLLKLNRLKLRFGDRSLSLGPCFAFSLVSTRAQPANCVDLDKSIAICRGNVAEKIRPYSEIRCGFDAWDNSSTRLLCTGAAFPSFVKLWSC